ncbi:hypothetical protein GW17_00020289 [Ensete ventricosum]|nr:hypothetical protein GW17_00020289 [Ensete ventricosum]
MTPIIITVDERYAQWKSLVPGLHDWLFQPHLVWASLSCRWGPQLDQATYKNLQCLYLSEQASEPRFFSFDHYPALQCNASFLCCINEFCLWPLSLCLIHLPA